MANSIGPSENKNPQQPISPTTPQTPPPGGAPPESTAQTQSIDPAGIWAKFLSTGGQQATPEEVKMFLQNYEKMLSVLVQQNQKAFARAQQQMREALEGE